MCPPLQLVIGIVKKWNINCCINILVLIGNNRWTIVIQRLLKKHNITNVIWKIKCFNRKRTEYTKVFKRNNNCFPICL